MDILVQSSISDQQTTKHLNEIGGSTEQFRVENCRAVLQRTADFGIFCTVNVHRNRRVLQYSAKTRVSCAHDRFMLLPSCIMHALQRQYTENSKQIFQEMKLRGLSPNSYIHVSVSVLYILTIGLPILLQENMWTDGGNM